MAGIAVLCISSAAIDDDRARDLDTTLESDGATHRPRRTAAIHPTRDGCRLGRHAESRSDDRQVHSSSRSSRSCWPIRPEGGQMGHSEFDPAARERRPWNAGRMVGAKRALKPQQVWAIRFWLDREGRLRDRAMFDLAIDSKLRGCDVVKIRIGELVSGGRVRARATVVQQKTGRPVQFELLEPARASIQAWLERRGGTLDEYAFPSRSHHAKHISTRQYARFVDEWVTGIGLRREDYGTHSLRRTKASIIYKATGNLRAVQILLGTATYCPRTSGRRADLLSVPSALRRDCADQATARAPRRRTGGHLAARQLTRLHSAVDDARGRGSIYAQ